jgi:hypothetical protein
MLQVSNVMKSQIFFMDLFLMLNYCAPFWKERLFCHSEVAAEES